MRKTFLKILVVFVCLVLIAGIMIYFLVDLNQFKPRIQEAATGALKKEVTINGRISLMLLPHLGATLHDVRIGSGAGFSEKEIITVERIRVSMAFLPLLRRKIEVSAVDIVKPRIRLERNAEGLLNIGFPENRGGSVDGKEPPRLPPLTFDRIFVREGDLFFIDQKSGRTLHSVKIDVEIMEFRIQDAGIKKAARLAEAFTFKGRLKAGVIKNDRLKLKDLSIGFAGEQGIITLDPLHYEFFGSKGAGRGIINLKGDKPVIEIDQKIPGLDLEEATTTLSGERLLKGRLDVSMHLSSTGDQANDFTKYLNGEITASARDLILYHYDIDTILDQYEQTRDTDMIDLGALFLAGPLGIALTKGFDAFEARKGLGSAQCPIPRLISQWNIANGVARAADVALATERNRIAAKGNLDLVHSRFANLVVAVLDEKGCAKYSQEIKGTFDKPRLEKAEFVANTITGMVSSIFKKAKKMLGDSPPCRIFYEGSVPHPAGKKP